MHLCWITNIPTPYRNHRYQTMAEVFPEYGMSFEVLFMAHSEHDRHWRQEGPRLDYPHTVFSGIHPVIGGWTWHLNPGLIKRLLVAPPDLAILGGFAHPNIWLLHAWRPRNTKRIMMVESNLDSAKRMSRLSRWVKGRLLSTNQAFVVPGLSSRAYIESLAPQIRSRPFFELPNLIDEALYVDKVDAIRASSLSALRGKVGVPESDQLWFCPARLIESKGLHLFLPLLEGLQNVHLMIAGTGPLKTELENLVAELRLPVQFLGNLTQEEMIEAYAAADVFLLPSLGDPSPLSAVEACAAELPVVVSDRIGNLSEVLNPGVNGWEYDPDRPMDFTATLQMISTLQRSQLRSYGLASRAAYRANFDSKLVIAGLAEFLLSLKQRAGAP